MRKKMGEQVQMIKKIAYVLLICILISAPVLQSAANQLSDYQQRLKDTSSAISSNKKQIQKLEED